jgi:outer membrane lipoprotein-sorting protein
MKRAIVNALGAVTLTAMAVAPCSGQTAQEVLSKMIDAMGGRKALQAVKDTTISGSIEVAQYGLTASLTMYQKEPNKQRMDIDVMGMIISQGFDGNTGWFTDPQSGVTQEMPEAQSRELARQAQGNAALLDPGKFGIALTLKPRVDLDGREHLVLEQTWADGHTITFFIDPATYLPAKTRTRAIGQAGVEVDSETFLADYRKVGNTVVAHSIRNLQDGIEAMRLTVTKVVTNSNLDDALFAMK